jgi:hypothetical protein
VQSPAPAQEAPRTATSENKAEAIAAGEVFKSEFGYTYTHLPGWVPKPKFGIWPAQHRLSQLVA